MNLITPQQFKQYSQDLVDHAREASNVFKKLIKEGNFRFFCSVCKSTYKALPSDDWNLRNQVICPNCELGGRLRHLSEVIESVFPTPKDDYPRIAIFEAVTTFAKLISKRYPATCTSEYIQSAKQSGERIQILHPSDSIVTHQNIQSTSYSDGEFDAIVHADVYEHIPSIPAALIEAKRILKKNGLMFFTMPLYDHNECTQVRSLEIESGVIDILPNQFHGNPIDSNGALVFVDPGFDFFELAHDLGFNAAVSLGFEPFKGYFPDCNPNNSNHCWNIVIVLESESHESRKLIEKSI